MTPRDQAARDRIRGELKTNLFVEAGAGTGKTRSLVDRICALADAGMDLRRMVAITFTNKAAAELRERVRVRLEQSRSLQLAHLEASPFGTIDAFVRRLLDRYPLESGLPPGWRAIADDEADEDLRRAWPRVRSKLLADPELETCWRTMGRLELKLNKALAWFLADERPKFGPPPHLEECVAPALEAARMADGLPEADRLVQKLREIEAAVLSGDLEQIAELSFKVGNAGSAQVWGERKEAAKALLKQAEAARDAWVGAGHLAALMPLVRALWAEADLARKRRLAHGLVTFRESMECLVRLLSEHPGALAETSAAFDTVMLDEFQDTDSSQYTLARMIASASADPSAPVPPGRLFVVGDPKQSIYRFRQSDLNVYFGARSDGWAQVVELTENFRSVAPVLDWTQQVCVPMLAGDPRVAATPLHAGAPDAAEFPGQVRFLGGPSPDSVEECRRQQARDLCTAVAAIIREGWPVREGEDLRPARAGDITVLAPRRSVLAELESELVDLGVPFSVESEKDLFSTQEGARFLNLLSAILDPSDAIATVAALRTPQLGVSDAELQAFADRGGDWTRRESDGDCVVSIGLGCLGALAELSRAMPVGDWVSLLAQRLRVFDIAAFDPRGAESRSVWRALTDHARAFQATEQGTLAEYRRRCELDLEVGLRVSLQTEPMPDRMRLMTVHAAKGLEFPIVLLAGLEAEDKNKLPVVLSNELRLSSTPRVASFGWDRAAEAEAREQLAESNRLLYVATTRARDHLVVCLHRRGSVEGCDAARLALALGEVEIWRPEAAAPLPTVEPPGTGRLARARGRIDTPSIAVSALVDESWDAEAFGGASPEGARIGRAVHTVLQIGGDDVGALAKAQAQAERVPEHADLIEAMARRGLMATEKLQGVHEVWLTAEVEGVRLEGFVDFVWRDGDGTLGMIDYKTDGGDIDQLMSKYRRQAGGYALLGEQVLGAPVGRFGFVFLRHDPAQVLWVSDLAGACDEVRQVLQKRGVG